jgi:hypothetical protein
MFSPEKKDLSAVISVNGETNMGQNDQDACDKTEPEFVLKHEIPQDIPLSDITAFNDKPGYLSEGRAGRLAPA